MTIAPDENGEYLTLTAREWAGVALAIPLTVVMMLLLLTLERYEVSFILATSALVGMVVVFFRSWRWLRSHTDRTPVGSFRATLGMLLFMAVIIGGYVPTVEADYGGDAAWAVRWFLRIGVNIVIWAMAWAGPPAGLVLR